MATDEELRAELYQRQRANRAAFRASLEAKLHGSTTALRELEKNWDPYYQWTLERDIRTPVGEDC